jgi:hypothetical protein
MHKVEKIVYPLLAIYVAIIAVWALLDPLYYTTVLAREDGPVEWLTVMALVLSCGVCIHRVMTLKSQKNAMFIFVWSFLALFAFFGAGEEISWGQRIFGIESSEWFKQNNAQAETNLHNLVVDGKKVNKIIFSMALGAALLTYLIVFSIAYRKSEKFKNFCEYFAVPIAQWHQVAAWFTVALVAEGLIKNIDRSSELFESAAAFVFLMNILYPYNAKSFEKKN